MHVRWLPRAILGLDEIEIYIAEDSPAVAVDAIVNIIKTVSLLKNQQRIGRTGRVPGTKELVVPDLPYIVPYRVKDKMVKILRVYHSSRKWPNRL